MKAAAIAFAGATLALTLAAPQHGFAAENFPTKPLRFLVAFAPGGGADIVTRAISGKLSEALGQPVIVDNRAGAGGNIAVGIIAKSDPDGHTLLMANVGALTVNPSLYSNLPYSVSRDLAPVTKAADSTNILCLNASVAAANVRELIALAKNKSLNAGSSGVGTTGHLAIELFNTMAGTKLVHVPYKGGGPVMLDVIAGNIQLVFSNPASAMAHIKAGKVKPIAVTTTKRLQAMPELPTVAESGLPGFEANNWIGVVVPAGTPRNRIDRLNKEIGAILNTSELRDFLVRLGFEANPGTPEQFGSYIKSETLKWSRVVKISGAKGE
jgi:tripartite-type tricarboxylate transporter receptor subunit TctC